MEETEDSAFDRIENIVESALEDLGSRFDSQGNAEVDSLEFVNYIARVEELVEERLRVPGKASACLGRDAP